MTSIHKMSRENFQEPLHQKRATFSCLVLSSTEVSDKRGAKISQAKCVLVDLKLAPVLDYTCLVSLELSAPLEFQISAFCLK